MLKQPLDVAGIIGADLRVDDIDSETGGRNLLNHLFQDIREGLLVLDPRTECDRVADTQDAKDACRFFEYGPIPETEFVRLERDSKGDELAVAPEQCKSYPDSELAHKAICYPGARPVRKTPTNLRLLKSPPWRRCIEWID